MTGGAGTKPIVTLGEAQAFARAETGEEEAILAGLVRTASALCETFLGQIVIERDFAETIRASSGWQRLATVPVRSIASVSKDGIALVPTAYSIDIDSRGYGWIRILDCSVEGTVAANGTAGIAGTHNAVPEPIRQGVLRLVAHLFASRDASGGEIPAAVTALWRPYRLARLA